MTIVLIIRIEIQTIRIILIFVILMIEIGSITVI